MMIISTGGARYFMSSNRPRSGKQRVGFWVTLIALGTIALDLPLFPIGTLVGISIAVGAARGVSEVIGRMEANGHGNPLEDISDATSNAVQKAADVLGRNMRSDQRTHVVNPDADVRARAEEIRRQQEKAHQEEEERRQREEAVKAEQERIHREAAQKAARQQEELRKEEEALPLSGDENADAVIKQGREMLRSIRAANAAIPEEHLTEQMNQLEYLCTQMFRTVSEKPAKAGQLRKFMSYYLPTTLKMLNNYSTMRKRGVSSGDLKDARETMERGMDMILTAAQKQLDALYKSDMLDVTTDIDVLEQMLKRDGFVDGGLGNIPTEEEAPASRPVDLEKPSSAAASRMGSGTIPTIHVEGHEEDTTDYRAYYQQKNQK